MSTQRYIKVSVSLDAEIIERLDREAAEKKSNRSQVLRERILQAWRAELQREGEHSRPLQAPRPSRHARGGTGARGGNSPKAPSEPKSRRIRVTSV